MTTKDNKLYLKKGNGCCEAHPGDKKCGKCGHETLRWTSTGLDHSPWYEWRCRYCNLLEKEKEYFIYKIAKKDLKRLTFIVKGKTKECIKIEKFKNIHNKTCISFKINSFEGYIATYYYDDFSDILIDGKEYKFNTSPSKKYNILTFDKCRNNN